MTTPPQKATAPKAKRQGLIKELPKGLEIKHGYKTTGESVSYSYIFGRWYRKQVHVLPADAISCLCGADFNEDIELVQHLSKALEAVSPPDSASASPAIEKDEGKWSETLTRGEVKRWIQNFPLNSIFSTEDGSLKGALNLKEQLTHNIQASPDSGSALKAKIDEIRGAVERESYWCEDCQLEYPKAGFVPSMHAEHEVVPITVIAGWRSKELAEIAAGAGE